MVADGGEPDPERTEPDAGMSSDTWAAYPVFVLVFVVTALLATVGPAALLWPLLSVALIHSHH